VVPDQSKATPKEMRVAGCMNFALDEVAKYLMKKGERGEWAEIGSLSTLGTLD